MKERPLPSDPKDRRRCEGLVLVGLGSSADALPPLERVTRELAELLQRRVLRLGTPTDPDAALAALAGQSLDCGGDWLADLSLDVGLPLGDGRCWAEALGAWRQPVMLVVSAAQLESGLPPAATALLRQWKVPLLGLLQWGGTWQAGRRRRDGLPWLGHLADAEAQPPDPDQEGALGDGPALVAAVALRRRQLELS